MTIPSCVRVSAVCPLGGWVISLLKSRHWFAGSEDCEKKLIGPRLIPRLGGIPGALARRELHMPDLAKPDGYKLISVFLEKKGYKKDALDRRLAANRWYEAIARRPGRTLQDFFATENMAYADAVKAGVGIDPDRSGKFVEILCLVGRLSLNSLSVRAITVREEPNLDVSPASETSQT